MTRPAWWPRARRALSQADPVMAAIIRRHPRIALTSRGDAFATLARSIVGQQISVKAADAVWGRLVAACPDMAPRPVLRRRAATLRGCGLSERKVEYLRDLAQHFASGRIDATLLQSAPDDEVIARLTEVRGIGRWTAEMFLIFHLMRPNVLPLDDIGLQNGISRAYFSVEPVSRSEIREVAASWAPYCSVATWYIWRSLDPLPVSY